MTTRALDDNGDLALGFIIGAEELAQNVRTRLRMYLGEWFVDTTDGTPWFQQIMGKGGDLSRKEAAIKRRILLTPGLAQMSSFSMDFDLSTRRLSVQTVIMAQSGETTTVQLVI